MLFVRSKIKHINRDTMQLDHLRDWYTYMYMNIWIYIYIYSYFTLIWMFTNSPGLSFHTSMLLVFFFLWRKQKSNTCLIAFHQKFKSAVDIVLCKLIRTFQGFFKITRVFIRLTRGQCNSTGWYGYQCDMIPHLILKKYRKNADGKLKFISVNENCWFRYLSLQSVPRGVIQEKLSLV